MSKRKRPSEANAIYARHLGRPYSTNHDEARQVAIELMYRRLLTELASNRFKWEGLPDSVDVRFMELSLYRSALSVFFLDKRYNKFFALKAGSMGPINMMDNPTVFHVVGNQYTSHSISAVRETEKYGIAVPIWANYTRMPDLDVVNIYAHRLARWDRTIEINGDNARRSKVLVASENTQMSVENLNKQLEEGQGVIRIVQGSMSNLADSVQAVDLGVDPHSVEKLHIVRTRMWNECMGLLGIENANQDKKERLVAAEVDANSEQVSMMRYVNLNARKQAIEKIKRAYPGQFDDLSVRYYTDEERQEMGLNVDLPSFGGEEDE